MGTIIGKKFLLYIVLIFPLSMHSGITLEVRNSDGIKTDTIVAGQPFIVEATIDGVSGSVQAPTIAGLEHFGARRTGMYMSNINGVSSTKYTYQILIGQPGTYTIGPARLVHQQKEMISDVLSITVSHHAAQMKEKNQKKAQKELKSFLRLTIDRDHVVVGQKIHAVLRFYYQDSGLTLTNIGQPDLSAFDIQTMGKPIGGTAEVNGSVYRYAEWQWDMYAKQAGELVVPAYSADYEISVQDNRLFNSLFMFVNNRPERKRVYSNAVKVTVEPLPYSAIPVHAIGTFDSITASLSPAVAKEGEGMVLVIEISGDGNMHAVQVQPLHMPAELKYYDSNSAIIEPDSLDELYKKRFEFVVQGMKAGDWEIPEQTFTYFDCNKHAYVTLRTIPLSLTITAMSDRDRAYAAANNRVEVATLKEQEEKLRLNTKGLWYPVSEHDPLPWIVFHILFIAPLLYYSFPRMRHYGIRLFYPLCGGLRTRACKAARKKVNRCARSEDVIHVYSIFIELFAVLSHKDSSEITSEIINNYMRMHGFSLQECHDWDVFFERISRIAYAHYNEDCYELCRMATQWINRLEKHT